MQAYQNRAGPAPNELVRNIPVTIYTCIRIAKTLNDYKPDELDNFFHDFYEIAKIFTELLLKKDIYVNQFGNKLTVGKSLDEDLLANLDNAYSEDGFENLKYNYVNVREFVVILLRILSSKLSKFSHSERNEKNNMNDLYYVIIEKIPDPELNLEVISILNSLLLADYCENVKSYIPPVKVPTYLNTF